MGSMKTTIELPDALVREIKMKAVMEGRKLKDMMTDLLHAGIAAASSEVPLDPKRKKKPELPVVKCRNAASAKSEMTPGRVAAILQGQEVVWHAKTGR